MAGDYRILLAEDHHLFRQEVRKIIETDGGLRVTGEAKDGAALYALLEKSSPDLLIVDIAMPPFRAMEAIPLIKQHHPEMKILIMVMDHAKEYVAHAVRAGADGLLLKQYTASELLKAIRTIRSGKFYLSPQFERKKYFKTGKGARRSRVQPVPVTAR